MSLVGDQTVTQPLSGIRVLDLGTMVAAPYGATMLGDMGADVIKVEPPQGDEVRHLGPGKGDDSGIFVGVNRNKRSLVLDLRSAEGRSLFQRLLATSDVVIHNLRRTAREKLGLRYQDLVRHRADVISVVVSTYGESGPYAGRPGIDPSAQALSGFMSITGFADGDPLRTSVPIADATAANLVAFGVTTALFGRQRDGQGQELEVALLNGMVHLQPGPVGQYGLLGYVQPRVGNGSPFFSPYGAYRCRDGRLVHLAVFNDKFFANLCRAIARPDLAADPRYATNALRLERAAELDAAIQATIAEIDCDDLMQRLQTADAIAAPVNSVPDMFVDPQVANNEMLVPVTHRDHGKFPVGGVPVKLSRTPGSVRLPPPALGEHTAEILASLGLGDREVATLMAPGGPAAPACSRGS